ncbi:hypothetical protein ACFV98_39735 [Streptomyces violascens]|uniref:hypothetical protein n=1 Tax=Streptomyces violascens TaxID=67381 RepID=UPI0036644514
MLILLSVPLSAPSALAVGPSQPPPGAGVRASGLNACGVSPQVAALTPLLDKLGLSRDVNGVKQLVNQVSASAGHLLSSPEVSGPQGLAAVISQMVGKLGAPVDLTSTATALAEIMTVQLPCLLDTALPLP